MLRTALSRASPDAGLGFARRRSLRRPAAAGTTAGTWKPSSATRFAAVPARAVNIRRA